MDGTTRAASSDPFVPDRLWRDLGGAAHRPDFRFDETFYGGLYPDTISPDSDPYLHYLAHGRREGRVANRYGLAVYNVDPSGIHEELARLVLDPELRAAIREGRPGAAELAFELISLGDPIDRTVSNFSQSHYLRASPDLRSFPAGPLVHYLKHGRKEGRRTLGVLRRNVREGGRAFDPDRPTCLVASHEFSKTGAPVVALEIAREAARTHNVVVMALRDGELVDRFLPECCALAVTANPFDDWDFLGLDEILGAVDFAILNSVETFPFVKPLVARGIPVAAYVHEYTDYTLPAYKAVLMALYVDRLVFSAEAVRDSWTGLLCDIGFDTARDSGLIAQDSLEFVPVDPERRARGRARLSEILGVDCSERRIVYGAGHMQMRKGSDLFVMTAQQVAARDRDTLFVWIGDGANHEDIVFGIWLDKHLREAGADTPGGTLFTIPAGPYYHDVCAAADILFLPSRLDPLPNVVFDAARFGASTVVFRGATGFDDALYDDLPFLRRVPYGDLGAAADALLEMPLKGTEAYAALSAGTSGTSGQDRPNVFASIRGMLRETPGGAPGASSPPDGPPLAPTEVSVLYRPRDYLEAVEAGGPDPRLGERAVLDRTGRQAIWPDPETAARALRHEGGWMHARSRIVRGRDVPPGDGPADPPYAIHVHAHYLDGLPEDMERLLAYRRAARIVVTTDTDAKAGRIERMGRAAGLSTVEARVLPNQGRDILPFLRVVAAEGGDDGTIWAHVHQKKSIASTEGGDEWRAFLLRILMGDGRHLSSALGEIAAPGTGLVAPFDPYVMGWTASRRLIPEIEHRLGRTLPPRPLLFPVGNMFWTRAGVARRMLDLFGADYHWPNEPLPNDGTIYHMIERLWPAAAASMELDSVFLDRPGTRRT